MRGFELEEGIDEKHTEHSKFKEVIWNRNSNLKPAIRELTEEIFASNHFDLNELHGETFRLP